MRTWSSRRIWLALWAVANLVVWGAAAYSVSLVASDRLDLGIESSVREVHATAIAAWSADRPRTALGGPGDIGGSVASAADLPADPAAAAGPENIDAVETPRPAEPLPEGAPRAPEGEAAMDVPSGPPETGSTAAPEEAAAALAFTTPERDPLILADPPFGDLTGLDQEMAQSAPNSTVQIRYRETSLNEEIARLLSGSTELPYRDVRVDLRAASVVLMGEVEVLGTSLQVEVKGSLVAAACRPQIEVRSVKIGRLFTPVTIRDQVARLVNEALDWYPADYPLCIDGIVTTDDRATVYGHRR